MLQAILVEIARAQEHGFSQQELDSAIAQEMADAESAYRERGQTYSVVGSPPNSFCLIGFYVYGWSCYFLVPSEGLSI